jgi:hypothetical protein
MGLVQPLVERGMAGSSGTDDGREVSSEIEDGGSSEKPRKTRSEAGTRDGFGLTPLRRPEILATKYLAVFTKTIAGGGITGEAIFVVRGG